MSPGHIRSFLLYEDSNFKRSSGIAAVSKHPSLPPCVMNALLELTFTGLFRPTP
jgi:hypothetical protein